MSAINKSDNGTIPEFNFNFSRATVTAGLIWIYAGYSKQEETVALSKYYFPIELYALYNIKFTDRL